MHWRVGAEHSVVLQGAGSTAAGVAVFSTPAMILLMELTAKALLTPFLTPEEQSVGVNVSIEHLGASLIGAQVRGEATVTEISGRQIQFDVAAFDQDRQIGRGVHRRAVIDVERVRKSLAKHAGADTVSTSLISQPNPGELPSLKTLNVEVDGLIAKVQLNRPDNLNAVDSTMTSELESLNAWLAGHREIRVVILTGSGRAFCAGDDVSELPSMSAEDATALSRRQAQLYLAWEQLPQIFIAAVNGPALGAGCVAAYSCDIRLAATNAIFGMPEIVLGWPPGYGVAQLTALVGKARALELCLTGEPIRAQQALDWGLASQVVPANQLAAAAQKRADQLLTLPAEALRETKRVVHQDEGIQPKVSHLNDTSAYIRCLQQPDAAEGIAAFLEKRPPQFRGE